MVKQNLDYLFNPKSVAIIGVSSKQSSSGLGAGLYLQCLLTSGFKGGIHPVNPKGGEISGLEIYKDVRSIPGPVDYAICCISAKLTAQLIKDCIAKRVKVAVIYTGGFSELENDEGERLEGEISSMVHESGIRVVGPNCLGVYCPKTGLSFAVGFPSDAGPVSFISQSGGNSTSFVREAAGRYVRFSKVISYGNACDVNESDLLEYLANDPDTEVITTYIEGVNDGRRFFKALKKATKIKPVIMIKGGVSEAGQRAVASHTGSLAGSQKVWDAVLRQLGVVRVNSLEELVDEAVTFTHLRLPAGRKVGLLGMGGGSSVLATDICTNAGLKIPRFSAEMQGKLRGYSAREGVGLCISNPVDLSGEIWGMCYNCAKIMLDSKEIDLLIFELPMSIHRYFFPELYTEIASALEGVIKAHKESSKPTAIIIPAPISSETFQLVSDCEKKCYKAGLPTYHSLNNAAKAIAQYLDYHEHRANIVE